MQITVTTTPKKISPGTYTTLVVFQVPDTSASGVHIQQRNSVWVDDVETLGGAAEIETQLEAGDEVMLPFAAPFWISRIGAADGTLNISPLCEVFPR